MAVRIRSIRGESDFLNVGDQILSIDSRKITDQLDLLFILEMCGEAEISIRKSDGRILSKKIDLDVFDRWGIVLEPMKFKRCRSRCIFCFVDQMPKGLRSSLYIKDDDYRLSFIYGNYITLNEVEEEDMERIIEYHLSPLYISVHAVDSDLRKHLFGRNDINDILEKLNRLAEGEIEFHSQIVVVPEVNDGDILDETVNILFDFHPNCKSVAVVPVGLTEHRENLPPIGNIDRREMLEIIEWADEKRADFTTATGGHAFLYLADEFYLGSDTQIPPYQYYDDLPQISNGIGMSRVFIDDVKTKLISITDPGEVKGHITIATGKLGNKLFCRYILPLTGEVIPGLQIDIVEVKNSLFGKPVTVSGLLAGSDIVKAVKQSGSIGDVLVIPPNAVNFEGLLIDDTTTDDLSRELGVPVVVAEENFLEKGVLGFDPGEKV